MNRIPFLVAGVFVIICFFTSSCDLPPPQQSGKTTENSPVAGVVAGGTTSFWKAAEYGARHAAEKNDLHLVWQETSQPDDFDQQVAAIRNLATRRVQGMIIATQNELMIRDALQRVEKQGIRVLLLDCPPVTCTKNTSNQFSVVATDQFRAGQLAADELAGLLQEKGQVAIIRYSPASSKTENREKGFLSQIQSYPEIVVVGHDLYTGTDSRVARDKMTIFLRLYSKNGISQLDGLFISHESIACEMLPLIEQEKLDKKIHFVAFGSDPRLVTGMLSYLVDALFVEQPARMGQLAIDAMTEMLRGKTIAPFHDSGVHCITIDNLFSPYSLALLHSDAENSLEMMLNEFPDNIINKNHVENQ